ncbi:four helix bundle protein [Flavisolibacter ginsenosidimutans]|uniref:Four helix bundle protein n=1 Tax=Flavisolibacter ginsenosidimutans TaxID=661481 RepID=A0A5B8UHA4_9BACT|nr:four helix bundle protein [Flavisolibacter ginsenosidimutans]QEC56014.1 four helix bundle protein [Flavisolibacter ginsenosidimutans]
MPFKFEQLQVWKSAIELSGRVHEICKRFPKDELFILTSQIKRASDSVSLNIAEGSTGQSNDEFNRFLGYALRSAIEVVSCLYLALNRKYISTDEFKELYDFIDSLCRKIQALRNSLK